MSQTNPIHKHVIHEGVDPQSWLGFEKRIEQRRFDSLLDVIRAALHGGDLQGAQAALNEARTLRPNSPELIELELQAVALGAPSYGVRFWTRMGSAVVVLGVGISMMFALELLRGAPSEGLAQSGRADGQIASEHRTAAPFASYRQPRPADASPTVTLSDLAATATVIEPVSAPAAVIDDGNRRDPVRQTETATPALSAGRQPETAPPSIASLRAAGNPRQEDPSERFRSAPTTAPRESTTPRVASAEPALSSTSRVPPPSTPPAGAVAQAEPPVALAAAPTSGARGESLAGRDTVAAESRLASAAELPARRIVTPAPAAATPPAVAVTPASTSSAPVGGGNVSRVEETRVADVLQRYARAYGELDARAAREVWPSVDERALARAFDNLVSQQVSLRDCQIDVRGETADASCYGEARYVGKVGSGEARTEPRAWRFLLRRDGDQWKIETAQAQRSSSASQ